MRNARRNPTGTDSEVPPARPGTRRRGRPVGDQDSKRTELIEAAIAQLAQDGHGASLRKVAHRANHTTGAVTYYFANREAMIIATVHHLFDIFDAILETNAETLDIRTSLERWFDWTRDEDAEAWAAQFQLLAAARNEPAVAAAYQERYARYRARFAEFLARGQEQGVVRDDISSDILSDQLCAMADGWMMLMPVEPERFEPVRIEALIDMTLAMVAMPAA